MNIRMLLAALVLMLGICVGPVAIAMPDKKPAKHSAAWYREHSNKKHSAAWYRKHKKHSAAWYRSHSKKSTKHSAAWYKKHGKKSDKR